MVVENKTNITSEESYKILMAAAKKDYIQKSWIIILIFIVGVPVLVIGLVQKETIYIVLGAIFIALSIIYLVVTLINIKRIPKKIKEQNKEITQYGAEYDYRFKEQSVDVNLKSQGKNNRVKLEYLTMKKAIEYDDHYVIRFEDYVLYVSKDGFQNKRLEEFFRSNITYTGKKKKRKIIDKRKNKESTN